MTNYLSVIPIQNIFDIISYLPEEKRCEIFIISKCNSKYNYIFLSQFLCTTDTINIKKILTDSQRNYFLKNTTNLDYLKIATLICDMRIYNLLGRIISQKDTDNLLLQSHPQYLFFECRNKINIEQLVHIIKIGCIEPLGSKYLFASWCFYEFLVKICQNKNNINWEIFTEIIQTFAKNIKYILCGNSYKYLMEIKSLVSVNCPLSLHELVFQSIDKVIIGQIPQF